MKTKNLLAKLYECSQELAIEAFMSESQAEAAKLYDVSHLIDIAIIRLKENKKIYS